MVKYVQKLPLSSSYFLAIHRNRNTAAIIYLLEYEHRHYVKEIDVCYFGRQLIVRHNFEIVPREETLPSSNILGTVSRIGTILTVSDLDNNRSREDSLKIFWGIYFKLISLVNSMSFVVQLVA